MDISSEEKVGEILQEGKTKIIRRGPDDDTVIIESKNDITAGDGAKHDIIEGKGAWATTTTCNVFMLLEECGIENAFIQRLNDTDFLAEKCIMIPYEIVVRRELHGSALKREPFQEKGHYLPQLRVEFFLKTANRQWEGNKFPVEDPLVIFNDAQDMADLYLPDQPIHAQDPFFATSQYPLQNDEILTKDGSFYYLYNCRNVISNQARKVFLVLEKQWQLLGRKLVDFKLEFGVNSDNKIVLADVVDADSWRLLKDGCHQDKQAYRDGGELSEVAEKYRQTAELSERFGLPEQQLIIWKASQEDKGCGFYKNDLADFGIEYRSVAISPHKEPVRAYVTIQKVIQEVPDSVLIVYCDRNSAGPTLSAQVTVPTVTVPTSWRDFPDDVWSSLRTPSETPCATILEPNNAFLHAMQILAIRNPKIYMELRFRQEQRLLNY
ncbi:MAG: AIR carboxylase family protein [Candidatus Nomurabacteria bacterium]|jgi:phosphoribosylaminoimidazole carboxylase/phosphoribosylaminoimidazole-succinocarboxamide synthase|nr:AIR carboxylase family protein [Candidatus Nomurabacteria bacterium]